jgi:hypothetical protein
MNLFRFSRFFLPSQNPIGFGASDFIALGLAVLLAVVFLLRHRMEAAAGRLAARTSVSMVLVGALPVALRLALLGQHPVPTPRVADDFSYLLLADTLAHFRLANPMHPMRRFFEGVFILQEPSYSSIFPPGQGLALACGQLIFGHPWAGVLLSTAAFCALCYWMLRAWVAPGRSLAGGLLAALEFGPLSPWMNTYWGGAVSAAAGCLVFGALPRIKRNARSRDAVLLGVGLGLQLLTRPYEFVLLLLIVFLFFLPDVAHALPRAVSRLFSTPVLAQKDGDGTSADAARRSACATLAIAALIMMPAIALTAFQNRAVTGRWTTLPYMLSRTQYGIPTTFTFQPNPIPHRELTVEQKVDYDEQTATHGKDTDTVASWFERLGERVLFFRFFLLAPLYLALFAFIVSLREYRFIWVVLAIAVFWIGDNFYPYFYPHYVAAAACLFVLISVKGLERLSLLTIRGIAVGQEAARLILLLCLAHFLFWYGIHLSGNQNLMRVMSQYESWDEINYGDPEGRIAIDNRLAAAPGSQLVFARYRPQHGSTEWIRNAADIDRARVVWALDLGPEENEKLRRYYPNRKAWLLEPDLHPPKLVDYP